MSDDVRYPEVEVQLSGEDGNAYGILGVVGKALRRQVSEEAASSYVDEATQGDYDHLLRVTMTTVTVL